MIIDGFNKLTLLDYPGHVACILFTRGCNFRCGYCHNSGFLENSKASGAFSEEEILDYLRKRKNVLEGVVISGGEPTIQKDIVEFIETVKEIGLKVKLDTNGTNPAVLKNLIDRELVDYVAMDIKTVFDEYESVAGVNVNTERIKESIKILKGSDIDYELRTTIFKEVYDLNKILKIVQIADGSKLYIQNFVLSDNVKNKNLHGFTKEELNMIKDFFKDYKNVFVRGL